MMREILGETVVSSILTLIVTQKLPHSNNSRRLITLMRMFPIKLTVNVSFPNTCCNL